MLTNGDVESVLHYKQLRIDYEYAGFTSSANIFSCNTSLSSHGYL